MEGKVPRWPMGGIFNKSDCGTEIVLVEIVFHKYLTRYSKNYPEKIRDNLPNNIILYVCTSMLDVHLCQNFHHVSVVFINHVLN